MTFIASSLLGLLVHSSRNFVINDVTQVFFDFPYMVSHTTTRGNTCILIMVTTRRKHIIAKFNQANSRRYARTFKTRMSEKLIA
jgi:hypothetical protein